MRGADVVNDSGDVAEVSVAEGSVQECWKWVERWGLYLDHRPAFCVVGSSGAGCRMEEPGPGA